MKATCKNCGLLPEDDFYPDYRYEDRLMKVCKECHKARTTASQYKRRMRYGTLGLKITRVEGVRGKAESLASWVRANA